MYLQIHWSDRLENLARKLFALAVPRKDPFESECTVTGSPVMAGWLKQYFLYDFPQKEKKNPVLAGWDFKMLHPFVNDWLAKACVGTPIGQRDPAQHPYSPDVLQWRIWNELSGSGTIDAFKVLSQYVGDDPKGRDRKRWGLVARLAKLFDDYQNYRVDLLEDWAQGGAADLSAGQAWQAVLWQRLVKAEPGTYLKQFKEMPRKLATCGITDVYRRITVFHTSAMPRAYMEFFVELGKIMDVQMFIFNPSREFWIEDLGARERLQGLNRNDESLDWLTPAHPILNGFGRGTQALLATVLDVTEGSVNGEDWGTDEKETLLQKIQADIRGKDAAGIADASDDGSIQFHVCHGPQREVEVARDLLLKWFEEHPESQPRDVQVLVPDMDAYAPFIESVFQVNDHNPPIPCSISKRPAVSAGAVGAAFVRLMKFNESRMTASEAVELLELDPVRERYGLEPADLGDVRGLVNAAGIRWGRDGEHLADVVAGTDLPDTVTWRRGLDRLLAGFAVGRCADGNDVIEAAELGALLVQDRVEGGMADLLGKLGQYFEDLCETADGITRRKIRKVSEWEPFYTEMLGRFFRGTESSFLELAELRRGIAAISRAAKIAGDPEVGADVMTAAIEAHLGGLAPAGKSDSNAVLFSPLRTMQVTPRKLIILLGLNEGDFPRADQRPAFDLLGIRSRPGDRSLRYEDRLAFLEAVMSARERLVLVYTGRNISNNKEIPPSPAVTEFRQYLDAFSEAKDKDGKRLPLVAPFEHKLHGFNPEYYRKDSRLFSYSRSNYAAACALVGQAPLQAGADNKPASSDPGAKQVGDAGQPAAAHPMTLEELQEFFVNPARHFFREVLQIQLVDPARDCVSDSEVFDGDTLEDYKLNEIMLTDLLGNSESGTEADFEPGDDYYHRLQEQALIPLGTYGRGSARRQLLELRDFLNTANGACSHHGNLYQALQAQRAQGSATVAVHCGKFNISGALPIITHEGCGFLLRFRYATIKPKDRVRAWVAHVVGHAAGCEFHTHITGKKGEHASLPPISVETAREVLGKMVDLYEEGCRAQLCFSPGCSYAYVNCKVAAKSDKDPLEAACDVWSNPPFAESNDPYLSAAWGEDGPMAQEDFCAIADAFWEESMPPSKGEQAGEAAAKREDCHE